VVTTGRRNRLGAKRFVRSDGYVCSLPCASSSRYTCGSRSVIAANQKSNNSLVLPTLELELLEGCIAHQRDCEQRDYI